MSKLPAATFLAATFALLAVASGTDVYLMGGYATNDCTGTTWNSMKQTLGQCTAGAGYHFKTTLSGSTYSYNQYTDSACSTPATYIVPNPLTGVADACIGYQLNGTAASIAFSTAYASGAETNYDCTSGTCALATPAPTSAPTSAPTNAPTNAPTTAPYMCDICAR